MEYSDSKNQVLSVFSPLFKLFVFQFSQVYLGKTMRNCKFFHSWLTKGDMNGRKNWGRICDDELSFYCKICKKNLSCCKGIYILNQHILLGKHKKQVGIHLNPLRLQFDV